MHSKINASVIISTYNQPKWLELVLWSYQLQTVRNFEIVIADDGSSEATKLVIEQFIKQTDLAVQHIWQEDQGFQKTKILNKAIIASFSDYLIFTDGDCIARNDFVETHIKSRVYGYALSAGYVKLNEVVSKCISKEVITKQWCFDNKWLLNMGLRNSFRLIKVTKSKFTVRLLNNITTTKATFDGMNVSCWKQDILAVNGFDERMQYGGEDREVGERLMNYGVKFKQMRYSAICVHLFHERPYKTLESLKFNAKIRANTKTKKLIWTDFGIKKCGKIL